MLPVGVWSMKIWMIKNIFNNSAASADDNVFRWISGNSWNEMMAVAWKTEDFEDLILIEILVQLVEMERL